MRQRCEGGSAMKREHISALTRFDTPTVANALELLRVRDPSAGYTGPDVRALMPDMGVRAGIAVTARLDTTSPGTDVTTMELFWEMVRHIEAQAGVPVVAVVEAVGVRPRDTVTIGEGVGT